MSEPTLDRALARAERHLEGGHGLDALVFRMESGRATPDDTATAANWIRRALGGQRQDGSWDGNLVTTARALIGVRALAQAAGLREVDPGVGRGLAWLRQRQGEARRFGEGCDEDRHRAGLCHHFLGGFFALGPGSSLAELRLDQGAVVRGDGECRFAASALALEALHRWGVAGTDVRLHMDGLRRVLKRFGRPGGVTAPATLVGVEALLHAPFHGPDDHDAVGAAIMELASHQLGDGSWSGVDVFLAVDVLLLADARGVAADSAAAPLRAATRLLAWTQQDDGGWGGEETERRALIAWRALRRETREGAKTDEDGS